ncbi:MAG: hypothetical protein WC058_15890 [Phycisphaeraceae bacterium]
MLKKKQAVGRDEGKARFELRFDADLYERIKSISDQAGVSVNQFMQGVARWAADHVHFGEPHCVFGSSGGVVLSDEKSGVVWFGEEGVPGEGDVVVEDENGQPRIEGTGELGYVAFALDFSAARAVRTDVAMVKGGVK